MRCSRPVICLLPFFAALVATSAGCALFSGRHWDATRTTVIEPINSVLHKHLPRDIRTKDVAAVRSTYATETGSGLTWENPTYVRDGSMEQRIRWVGPPGEEPLVERYERLWALFDTIEWAELRIHRIHWERRDAFGYPADVRLIVRGIGPDHERRMLDQRAELRVDKRDGKWVVTGEEILSRELLSSNRPGFELVTREAGIGDVHDTSGSPTFRLIGDVEVSSGAAVADFDCDGREDLALLSSSWLRLYRNDDEGSFTDATGAAGLPSQINLAGSGIVFFDADNDGDPDLWLSGIYGDRLLRNQGCKAFTDVTAEAGITQSRWSSMPVVADYDLDGFLDVYVVRMGDHAATAPKPNWDAGNGIRDSLYRNNGDGTFTDVSDAAGIDETGWGLASAWGDYNADGYPDLYVGNEFGQNSLYRNDRDGTFTDVTDEAGVSDRGAAMGVAWGDYNNDGLLDLFVSNMYANSRWALFHPDFPSPVPWYFSWVPRSRVDQITHELTRGSTLLRNNGDGTFTDVSDDAGVRDGQWGWGLEFVDYNNDGRLDVYAANGFITGDLPDDI